MLTVNNITCYKNQQLIFKNLGFSLGLGSALVISGSNGSGKTTLLKIIAGLVSYDNGEILWNSQNIKDFFDEFSADINYIGHSNFLKPQLTVWQNLFFYAEIYGTKMLLPAAIRYFNLDKILEKKVNQISSGWQKKVMLAKLLYNPATIWILDEPTVNLDEESKKTLFNLVSTRIKDGGMVIIASHDKIFDPIVKKIHLKDFI